MSLIKFVLISLTITIVELSSLKSCRTCDDDVIKDCTAPGLFCESCSRLTLCVKIDTGYDKTFVRNCTRPEKCLDTTCTLNYDPLCDGLTCLPYICNDIGVFPDPLNCKKYYYCIKETPTSAFKVYSYECDEGYGYNSLSKVCDVSLSATGNQCPTKYAIELCAEAGQTNALPDNPSIYYICKIYNDTNPYLYPFLYLCPHGEQYVGMTCQEIPTPPPITTTPVPTPTPITTPPPGKK